MQERYWEDQLAGSYEKWGSITQSQGGEEYPTDNEKKEGQLNSHILRRNGLLKHIIEGQIEGGIDETGRRGRKRKQLLDGLKETRGYLKLKAEALGDTL